MLRELPSLQDTSRIPLGFTNGSLLGLARLTRAGREEGRQAEDPALRQVGVEVRAARVSLGGHGPGPEDPSPPQDTHVQDARGLVWGPGTFNDLSNH